MTEETLSQTLAKRPLLRAFLIGGALFLVVFVAAWFARQAIAGAILKSLCGQYELSCSFRISRLDFGGATLRDVKVVGEDPEAAPVTMDRLAVDLGWPNPFGPRPVWIGGDRVVLRMDLRGGPLLGELDRVLKSLPARDPEKPPAATPRINLSNARIIAATALGPVEASGSLTLVDPNNFVVDFAADPARLAREGSELDLAAAVVSARASGGTIKGVVDVDLARFKAPGSSIENMKIDLNVDQVDGRLTAAGAASAKELTLAEGAIAQASATANLEAAAVDLAKATPESFVIGIRKLTLAGEAGPGEMSGAGWEKGALNAHLDPRLPGGASGEVSLLVDRLKHASGAAERLEVGGRIDLPSGLSGAKGRTLNARGTAKLVGASLSPDASRELGQQVESPLKGLIPLFAAAAARTAQRAGETFELTLPWAFKLDDGGFDASALSGTGLKAASGFAAVMDGGERPVVTVSAREGVSWAAAGSVRMSGGGGPELAVNVVKAAGAGRSLSAVGDAELAAWKLGGETLAGKVSGLEFESREDGGRAAGEVALSVTGGLAGGKWTRARASGDMTAAWSPEAFSAETPNGLSIAWDAARYGDMVFGAETLRYTPQGKLAETRGAAIGGEGVLGGLKFPVTGGNFTAEAQVGATAVGWTLGETLRATFDSAPSQVTMMQQDRHTPISLRDVSGVVEINKGWRVIGAFSGGAVQAEQALVNGLRGRFDLSGAGEALNGRLTDVAMSISDPHADDGRLFEPAAFEGSATLANGVADFTGLFTLTGPGVQIASVKGRHSLDAGAGALTFEPTPLIFRPRGFQPSALSPLLRGPANVTGRIDISGAATWDANGLQSSALADLRGLGFALASAGVFEGVSGKVAVSDLLKMTSAPGQTITLDKVTLGMPIEKGTIRFQLIGYDAIRLESAEWPFVTGKIAVQPVDFVFGADSNRIVAEAVNWDLPSLITLFKVPDVAVRGTVSGKFPVVFSTGSLRVDNALLEASSQGGVIQYTGSTADAAASADANAKMLFDALRDFRYKVLKVSINGEVTGQIVLKLTLLGNNPNVLGGADFDLNISIDSALMNLINSLQNPEGVDAVVDAVTKGRD
jgi:hypothetical protein